MMILPPAPRFFPQASPLLKKQDRVLMAILPPVSAAPDFPENKRAHSGRTGAIHHSLASKHHQI
jgi:hypothetical protein